MRTMKLALEELEARRAELREKKQRLDAEAKTAREDLAELDRAIELRREMAADEEWRLTSAAMSPVQVLDKWGPARGYRVDAHGTVRVLDDLVLGRVREDGRVMGHYRCLFSVREAPSTWHNYCKK